MPESYVPLDGRRQAVVIVFAAIALISVVAVVSDLMQVGLLDRMVAGEPVSDAELTANDDRQALVGIVQLAALIAGAITFIRWLHAAYRNVDVVEPSERRYGHGWAIGSWFVPILGLWRPKQIVNDVWRAGSPSRRTPSPVWLLLVWWLAFVTSNFVANGAIRSALEGDTPEQLPERGRRLRRLRRDRRRRSDPGHPRGARGHRPARRPGGRQAAGAGGSRAGARRHLSDPPAYPPRSLRGPR